MTVNSHTSIRNIILVTLVALTVSLSIMAWHMFTHPYSNALIIFHAGSLFECVEELSDIMETRYPGLNVLGESSGSVDAIRKVVDLGKPADVVMVADYNLIPELMIPTGKASWALVFASNEIVLAYTNRSRYADRVISEGWLQTILKPDVRLGFADPNRDPCGYRAIMVMGLTYIRYGCKTILNMLDESAGVSCVVSLNGLLFDVSNGVEPDSVKIFVRDKSVDLIALLEAGVIDYAFEYKSVAASRGLKYVELPREVNLADPSLNKLYSRVSVKITAGGAVKVLKGEAIAYGVTIPTDPPHPDMAREFIKLLLRSEGRTVLEKSGLTPFEKPLILGTPPDWLINLMENLPKEVFIYGEQAWFNLAVN